MLGHASATLTLDRYGHLFPDELDACGVHTPITPASFRTRVEEWGYRTQGAKFELMDYREALAMAREGDVVYCDPPYTHTQAILYGAQDFRLADLLVAITDAKDRGAAVALSIDGSKKSESKILDLPIPDGLFEREVIVNVGRSMPADSRWVEARWRARLWPTACY